MDFPTEILLAIFAFLDHHRYFYPLLLVSRLFKSLAEPLLYCEVNFNNCFKHNYTPQIQQFTQMITSQPDRRLAKSVKSFLIRESFTLPEILPELLNLRRLDVVLIYWGHCENFNKYLSHSVQLSHLRMTSLFGMATLQHFLELQPTLEYLDMNDQPGHADTIRLPPHALSRLRTLGAGSDSIRSILPGRDVHHLTVHNMFDADFVDATFPTVYTLRVHNYTFVRGLNRTLRAACHFANVKYLAVDNFDKTPSALGLRPSDIITFLRPLAVTKVEYISLKLHRDIYRELQFGNPSTYSNHFTAWLEAIPTLRVLDVGSDNLLLEYLGLRFTAGIPKPTEIWRPKEDFASWSLWWQDRGLEAIFGEPCISAIV